jgi:hypothetical protein
MRNAGTFASLASTRALTVVGALAVGSALAGSSAGCSSSEEGESGAACVSTREFFTTQVYGKAMQTCVGCHTPGGTADNQGAKFKMVKETYPDFVSENIRAIKSFSELEVRDTPLILLKPLGQREHGGGAVFSKDSEEFKILQKFVTDLRNGVDKTCNVGDQLQVASLDNVQTARKAAITLAGRFPTQAELDAAGSDEGLDAFILQLTREELFYDRLREIWNDALLTDRGVDAGLANTFDMAPELYNDRNPNYTQEKRNWASASLTEEPMRFIEYVVRNDLPFSDVVAGNYVVANPYVAKAYGLPHEKPLAPESYLEWQKIQFSPVQNQVRNNVPRLTPVPSAGVLTTPAFLQRWETTPTNKGRKRARIVLKNFLATDIFKFAQRPVDSTALTSVQNPTLNSSQCAVCHQNIDPIAGGFRGFDDQNMVRFEPDDKWHDDMLPPGFAKTQMPPQNYGNAIMWLAAQIPQDARFGVAIGQAMYRGIVGDEPLIFPEDPSAADYTDRVRAFNIQNDWFVTMGARFKENKFDLRKLVVEIVKSPYFRAVSGDAAKDGLHQGLGQGRLLTPEMLGRKYRATTGLYFYQNDAAGKDEARQRDGYLRSDLVRDRDWRLVYGGIDSGDTTKRTDTMSPIMVATSQYTGALVACRSTSYDFTKPLEARRLFRFVEMTTTPFSPRQNASTPLVAVPDAEPKIRENIKYLFWRLLGERVETSSQDVSDAFSLFVDVWKDLEQTDLTKDNGNKGIDNYRCRAETDWDAGVRFEPDQNGNLRSVFPGLRDRPDKAPYEPGMKLNRDENFTVRSWQAVVTYLLTDYRFTHE